MGRSLQRRLQTLKPLPENLFLQPLEYLRADHFRQLTLSRLLDDPNGSAAAIGGEGCETLLTFLESEFPSHLRDEDEILFPMIGSHSADASPLPPLIGLLTEMHGRLDGLRRDLADGLRAMSRNGDSAAGRRFWRTARIFGELLLWNVSIEDRVVLPSAEACLRQGELETLGHAMANRRHAVYPEPPS